MITKQKNYNAFFRQLIFIAVLIFFAAIIFFQLNSLLGSILGAVTIYAVLRNSQFYLTEKLNWRPWLAATLLLIATTFVLVGISYMVFKVIVSEFPDMNPYEWISRVRAIVADLTGRVGIQLVPENLITSAQGIITSFLSAALNATYSFTANLLLMLLVLYFMLAHARRMESIFFDYVPFTGDSLCLLKHEVKGIIYSNAVGIPVIMIGQAIVACLIYWLLGVNHFFFWGFLTAVAGLIPIVGTGLIWVPVSIFLIATGEIWEGIVLLLYGVLVISNTDNLLRIILMKKMADTHPLVVIFGVIMGIPLFGFWGIIFGPLFLSMFLLLMKIYFWEYELIVPKKTTPGDIVEGKPDEEVLNDNPN